MTAASAIRCRCLQSRIATLGKDNPYVQQWLKVQGKVLQVCSNPDTTDIALPEPMETDPAHPTMQAEDRAYQEATIAFYKDKPKAIELFRAIAAIGLAAQGGGALQHRQPDGEFKRCCRGPGRSRMPSWPIRRLPRPWHHPGASRLHRQS